MAACSIDDFWAWYQGERTLPESSFLITFDDGFKDLREHAAPVLRRLGWSGTVFLVSAFVGARDDWTMREDPLRPTRPLLDRYDIEAMKQDGWSFHSHSRHHYDLTTLPPDQLADEVHGSKRELERLLGHEVGFFAYPYGRMTDTVIEAVASAGYRAAFSMHPGFNRRKREPWAIRRLDVFGADTAGTLLRKVSLGSNDGSWVSTARYYVRRMAARLVPG
jgi:peptidoglycan/xylan/chitin deacetylase (PgdA/CDA1 family)